MTERFRLIVFSLLLHVASVSSDDLAAAQLDCSFVAGITDEKDLPFIKHSHYERCLLQDLRRRAWDRFKDFLKSVDPALTAEQALPDISQNNILKRVNPKMEQIYLKGTPNMGLFYEWIDVGFQIHHIQLDYAKIRENSQTLEISGYLYCSWTDDRLSWSDIGNYKKVKDIHITRDHDIWYPHLKAADYYYQDTHPELYHNTWEPHMYGIYADGEVWIQQRFEAVIPCVHDYTDFPLDDVRCTSSLTATDSFDTNAHVMMKMPKVDFDINIEFEQRVIDRRELKGWTPDTTDTRWRVRKEEDFSILELSLHFKRRFVAATIEYYLPVALASVLSILSPFFGSFKRQATVKVVVIVLMFLSLYGFGRFWEVGRLAWKLPKLLIFYEFSMVVTMVNLIVILLVWSLARSIEQSKQLLPVPKKLSLSAAVINWPFRFWAPSTYRFEKFDGKEGTEQEEWSTLFQAINCLLFIVFAVIYIVGALALCSHIM